MEFGSRRTRIEEPRGWDRAKDDTALENQSQMRWNPDGGWNELGISRVMGQTKVSGMVSSAPMGLSLIFVTSELKTRIPSKTPSSPDR
jgi:hypothetical protein